MHVNRHILAVLAALAACAATGCGAETAVPEAAEAAGSVVAEIEAGSVPTAPDEETMIVAREEPAAAIQPESGDPGRQTALSLVGSPVSALLSELGEPEERSYASSCNGPGEDGELYYSGFTVYTYRENDVETIVDVY